MTEPRRRPFYTEYAWAFDLIIDRPVRKECGAIAAWLTERGVPPGMEILDAGCGTGRYATELARRGYIVHGVDLSPQLIGVAAKSGEELHGSVSFAVGDIGVLPAKRYAGVLCRGVLNDILDDEDRDAIVAAFARALRPGGVLILDVREWEASAERKTREPLFRKRVSTDRGELTFTSITSLDRGNRQLLISESHALVSDGVEHVSDYEFVMRCWDRDELGATLRRHGFDDVQYFGAYRPDVEAGATDRLTAVAQLSRTARRLPDKGQPHDEAIPLDRPRGSVAGRNAKSLPEVRETHTCRSRRRRLESEIVLEHQGRAVDPNADVKR